MKRNKFKVFLSMLLILKQRKELKKMIKSMY